MYFCHDVFSVVFILSRQDYRTLLSQLEHAFNFSPQFTLTKLWFYVHPTVRTLSLIYNLILELETAAESPSERPSESDSSSTSDAEANARDEALGLGGAKFKALLSMIDKDGLDTGAQSGIAVKGGEVLTIIYERMQHMSGDPTARALYDTLFRAAGAPYVAMIKAWTTAGRLMDPYDEFCVKESKLINRGTLQMDYIDEYWEERYTVGVPLCCFVFISLAESDSFVTDQQHLLRRKDTSLVFLGLDQEAGDSQVAPVYHPCLKDGSTRFSLQGNFSMSFESVVSR